VQYSLDVCSAATGSGGSSLGGSGGAGGLFKLGFGGVSSAHSQQVAAAFVNERIRSALQAAHTSAGVVTSLQVQSARACA
jgi:hypothetical protein